MTPDIDLLPAIVQAQSMFLQTGELRPAFEHLLKRTLEISQSDYGFIAVGKLPAGGAMALDRVVTLASPACRERRPFEESTAVVLRWFNIDASALSGLASGRPLIRAAPQAVQLRALETELPRLSATLVVPFQGGAGFGLLGLANRPFGYADYVVHALERVRACCGGLVGARWPLDEPSVEVGDRPPLPDGAIVDSLRDGIIVMDAEGTIQLTNVAARRTFGYESQELIGLGIARLLSERHGRPEAFAPGTREVAGRRRDGSVFPLELAVGEGVVDDRAVRTAVVRDLSIQRRVENDLLRVCAITSDLLCVARLDGTLERINPAWKETLGYELDELQGTSLLDLLHPDDVEQTRGELAKLGEGEPSVTFVGRFRCKDGGYAWLDWSAVAAGSMGLIYGAARDATEQHDRASELEREAALQRSRLNGAAWILITTDSDGTIRTFNAAAERALRYEAAEIIGRNFTVLHDWDELARRATQISSTLRTPVLSGFDVLVGAAGRDEIDERDWTWLAKDGRRLPVTVSMVAVRDADGEVSGYLGMAWTRPESAAGPDAPEAARSSQPARRHRVLAVVDDRQLVGLLGAALGDSYEVVSTGSHAEALDLARTEQPGAVLLDIGSRDGRGFDVQDRMAELPEMGDVPIILIAGPDGPDARVGGPALIEWLDAPEDGEALARAVGRLVEGAFRPAVVTIDEDASRRSALVRRLTALGLACGEVNDIEAARRRLTGTMPDLVTFKIGTSSGSLRLLDMLCHSCAPSVPLLVYPDRYMTGEDDRALRLAVTRRLLTARHSEQNLPAALRELLEAIFARRTERRQPDRSVA